MQPTTCPAWRWELASAALKQSDASVAWASRNWDDTTRAVYQFRRAEERRLYYEGSLPDVYRVHRERPKLRLYVEGMLLSGEKDDALIGDMVEMSAEDVRLFHDVFFDVRPRLHREGWIAEQFFGGETFRPLSRHDTSEMYHRIAWLAGPLIFRAMHSRRPEPELRRQINQEIGQLTQDILARQSLLMIQCLGHGGELGLQSLGLALQQTSDAMGKALPEHQQALVAMKEQFNAFLLRAPLSVAAPKAPSNLLMEGGREPRVADLIGRANATTLTHLPSSTREEMTPLVR